MDMGLVPPVAKRLGQNPQGTQENGGRSELNRHEAPYMFYNTRNTLIWGKLFPASQDQEEAD
jgi:hypothetical protein